MLALSRPRILPHALILSVAQCLRELREREGERERAQERRRERVRER
jgi:hypothetical protein